MHLMKEVFRSFGTDHTFLYRHDKFATDPTSEEPEVTAQTEIRIPAVALFTELGKLFEQELQASRA